MHHPEEKKERWLLVRSDPAFRRENETFLRKHEKKFDELQKLLWHCECQVFGCENDAKKAIKKIISLKKHFYDIRYDIITKPCFNDKGRPKKNQPPDYYAYQVKISGISSQLIEINAHRETLGRFILATNIVDELSMSSEKNIFIT